MDTLENAQKRAEFWKAESLAATREIDMLRAALERIASRTQSTELLWWQVEARNALLPNKI